MSYYSFTVNERASKYNLIINNILTMTKTIKHLLLCTLILQSYFTKSQVVAEGDTVLCSGQEGEVSVTLSATSFAVDLTDSGIASDDIYGGVINMGFDFQFYGNTYNQVVLSSNNYLTFNTGVANGFSGWDITNAIPNNFNAPQNAILCPWQDINPAADGDGDFIADGTIAYATIGEAPERKFIVSFCGIPMFQCTDVCYSSQIILYEGTNVIETHIAQKVLCEGWNEGAAIHGLHNNNGTIAHVVTGLDGIERNYPNQWQCANDGWRFTPNGNNDYNIDNIEFAPAVSGTDIVWQDQFGNQIGIGPEIEVFPAGDVSYIAAASLCGAAGDWCGAAGGLEGDEVFISFEELSISGTSSDPTCFEYNDGSIELLAPNNGSWIYSLYVEGALLNTQSSSGSSFVFQDLSQGIYTAIITDENTLCETDEILFEINEPSEITVSFSTVDSSCNANDGSISINIEGGNGEYSTFLGGENIGENIEEDGSNISFQNLSQGSYFFTPIDGNGCFTEGQEVFFEIDVEGSIVSSADAGESLETCEVNSILNANVPLEGESGIWTLIEGQAEFSDITDPQSEVFNLGIGLNVFLWTLENECGNSSDEVTINVIDGNPSVSILNQVNCLDSIQLSVDVPEGSGTWTVSPDLGVVIENPNQLNTIATVSEYGTYTFTFEGCSSSDSDIILVQSLSPTLSGPGEVSCLDSFDLSAQVDGDPGYWELLSGPGNAIFSNINGLNTSVDVDAYGLYEFNYYGCGQAITKIVNMLESTPIIQDVSIINCDLSVEVTVESLYNGQWSVFPFYEDTDITNVNDNPNTVLITVPDYGNYNVVFSGCGGVSDTLALFFDSQPPHLIAQDHQNCYFNINLYAITSDVSGGFWEQISGPSMAQIASPNSNSTEAVVSEYGLYQFKFYSCGNSEIIEVGVSCPISVPNSFSPNGDGVNDIFVIEDLSPYVYSQSVFYVYNKWGRIVYMHPSYGLNGEWWDGRKTNYAKSISSIFSNRYKNNLDFVTDGIYFYTLELYNMGLNQKEFYSGDITIFSKEH